MKNWFEVKVKYNKTGEDGKEQKMSEVYLFDSLSFTESEARTFEQMKEIVPEGSEIIVDAIKKSRIIEIFPYDVGEYWFRIVVEMVVLNEGAKKKTTSKETYLIIADDIEQALTRINKSLDSSVVPYVINSVSISNIMDVFKYEEK